MARKTCSVKSRLLAASALAGTLLVAGPLVGAATAQTTDRVIPDVPKTRGALITSASAFERHIFNTANDKWTQLSLCPASNADERKPVLFVGIRENDPRIDKATRELLNSTLQRYIGGRRSATLFNHLGHLAQFLGNHEEGRERLQSEVRSYEQHPFLVEAETLRRQSLDESDALQIKLTFRDNRPGCGKSESHVLRLDLARLELKRTLDIRTPDGFELNGFYRRGLEQFSPYLTGGEPPIRAVSLDVQLQAPGVCLLSTTARQQFESHYNALGRQLNRRVNRRVLPGLRVPNPDGSVDRRTDEPHIRVTLTPTPIAKRMVTANMALIEDGILSDSFSHLVLVPHQMLDGCEPESADTDSDTDPVDAADPTDVVDPAADLTPDAPETPDTDNAVAPDEAPQSSTTTPVVATEPALPLCPACEAMTSFVHVRDATGRVNGLLPVTASGSAKPDVYIARDEVSVGEFRAFMDATGYQPLSEGSERSSWCAAPGPNGSTPWRLSQARTPLDPGFPQADDHPVVCVSWHDAKAYTAWLTRETGRAFRLLTAGEHSLIAQSGASTAFWWGASVRTDVAHYEVSPGRSSLAVRGTVSASAVPPSPWGIRHASGNVAEWVEDCAGVSQAAGVDVTAARTSVACVKRVLRGGGWTYDPQYIAATAADDSSQPHRTFVDVGFRIAHDGPENLQGAD